MSNTKNEDSQGKKKINLMEAMKQKLDQQKQDQGKASNKPNATHGSNKLKSQQIMKSTLKRGRTGE